MRALFLSVLVGSFCMLFSAEVAGIFKSVSGAVTVEHGDKSKVTPKVGDKFFESDTIRTAEKATAGLIFNDNTLISVGQKSEFSIKEYKFEPSEKRGRFVGKVGSGTIACMTGLIAKMNPESMKMESKTATIGIRGTYFVMEAE